MLPLSEPKGISCGVLEVFIAAIKIGLFQPLRCKGSVFFANMQALCVFAHAVEVSARENQRIRWRIVHGIDKGNSVFFETCKLFGLYSENSFKNLD